MKIPYLQFGDNTPLGRQLRFIAEQLKKWSESQVDGYNLSDTVAGGGLAFTTDDNKQLYILLVDTTQNSYIHPKLDSSSIQRGIEVIVDTTDTSTGKFCIVNKSDTTKQIISLYPSSLDGYIVTNYGSMFLQVADQSSVAITGGTNAGNVNVTGGAGSSTINGGGVVNIAGGVGFFSSTGGTVNVTGGAGASGGTAAGGPVVITGGVAGGASNGTGGAVVLAGGVGKGTRAGGAITLTGGAGATTPATGAGGAISITGGQSAGGATGNGGAASITGGAATSSNGTGGAVSVAGGAGAGSGGGGVGGFTGGAGGATGAGGSISITGGAGGATSGNGGDVTLAGGAKTSGTVGFIKFADATDTTKKVAFDISSVSTATTRTATFPDKSGTFAYTSDIPSFPLSKANQNAATVYNDQSNTWSTGIQDMSAATLTPGVIKNKSGTDLDIQWQSGSSSRIKLQDADGIVLFSTGTFKLASSATLDVNRCTLKHKRDIIANVGSLASGEIYTPTDSQEIVVGLG